MRYLWVFLSRARRAPTGGHRETGEDFLYTGNRSRSRQQGGVWIADGEPPVPMHSPRPRVSRPVRNPIASSGLSIVTVLALCFLEGCSGGGGTSHAQPSGNEVNGVASAVQTRDLGSGRIEVTFSVKATPAKQVGVDVDFSQDRGHSYSRATLETSGEAIAAVPE